MKAIQKIKQLATKITSITLFRTGSRPPVVTGVAPLARSVVTSAAPSRRHTGDSHTFVLRQRPFLSLYSYLTSRRIFTLWRSRTYIQNLRNIRIAGLSSSFLLGLLALAIIIPLYNVSGTEDTEAATGTATDSSITFTSTRTTATVNLTPTSTSGTFASTTYNSTDAAFNIYTTNSQGYELKIKSTSSNTTMKTSSSAADSTGLSPIASSRAQGSFAANTWGYLPNYYNCNDSNGACSTNSSTYYRITTDDVLLRKTATANNSSNRHYYYIGLGAKADLTRTNGTYTLGGNNGTITLSYVANPTTYSIAYDKGKATSDPSNMPSTQSGSVSATSVTLSPNTPTLTGYTFTGWCLGTVSTSSAEVDSCTGTGAKIFSAGGTFGIDRTSTNSVTLHAMWAKASVNVTVNFAGGGVTGVTFTNSTYGNVSVSTSGNTAALKYGVSYIISGTYSSGYEFSSWSATAGSLGSTTTASTTYSTTTTATLTLTGKSSGYTITFKANGGTGSDYAQTIAQGSADNLFGNSFTRSGYYFKGWGTNTSAVAYRPGQPITPSGDMTLYAIWGSSTSTSLYNIVASLNNGRTLDNTSTNGTGLSANAGIQADITKDNSGVFSYDSSTFGAASDASTSNTIYLYRGILDNVEGTYGSDGDSGNYPNYVRLSNNTCWRILRTTGSGGVKLIYNGTYGATTSGSCANARTKAQVIESAFNDSSASNDYTSLNIHDIHAVGYTYNNSVTSSTTSTAASAVFGSNDDYSVNSSPSIMKQYLENTWYTTNMTSYTSKLESSAGYCNDRSLYASGSYASALAETTTVVPFGTSSMTIYRFGAFARNTNSAQKPSLTCPRNVVDLYTTSTASNGNKQLTYPVALATADEMSFAGSGRSTASEGSSYNAKSFARSGSDFWLLSPSYRGSGGNAVGYVLSSGGNLGSNNVSSAYGVRPVISLKFGTTPESGSGTATDPWVVTPPPTMQEMTSAKLADLMPNVGDTATLVDSRDGSDYTVAKLADDHYWMTQNLRLGKGNGEEIVLTRSDSNVSSNFTLKASGMGSNSPDATGDCNVGDWYPSSTAQYLNVSHLCINTTDTNKYGVYYNWYTATAGTGTYSKTSGNATGSICPKGWTLPPSSGDRSYYNLLFIKAGLSSDEASSTTMQNAPYNFPLSGNTYGAGINDVGTDGYFWSSSAFDNGYAYHLYFGSSYIYPQYWNYRGKGGGHSVRCVFGS